MEEELFAKLYKEGHPIPFILEQTGLCKAVLYRRLNKLGITRKPGTHRKGKKLSVEHKHKISESLKGQYTGKDRWSTQQLKEGYETMTPELSYILGVMYGDGYFEKDSGIGLENIDKEFVDEFERCVSKQFGTRVNRYVRKRTGMTDWRNNKGYSQKQTYVAKSLSVLLVHFLKPLQNDEFIRQLSHLNKISFIRGIWDSDGSITISHEINLQLNFYAKPQAIAELYVDLVHDVCGFTPSLTYQRSQGIWKSYVYKKAYLKKFYETINPTIIRKRKKFEEVLFPE